MAYLNLISYAIVLPLFHFILAEVGVQPQNTAPQFNFDPISLSQELYKLFTQDWKEERLLEQDVTLLERERFNLKERRKLIEDLRQAKLNQQNGTNIDAQASMGIQNLGNGSAAGMGPNTMGPPGPGVSQVSGQSDTQASYSMNNTVVNPDGSISQVNMGAMPNDGQDNVMPAGMSMTPQTDGVNPYQDTQYDSNGQYSSGVSPPATDNNLNFSPQQQQLGPSNQPESFTQPLPNGSVQMSRGNFNRGKFKISYLVQTMAPPVDTQNLKRDAPYQLGETALLLVTMVPPAGTQGLTRDAPYQPGETALLLVDMQKAFLNPGSTGNPAALNFGPYFYEHTSAVTVPNAAKVLKAARENGVQVLHTIIQSLTEDGRDRSLDHKLSGFHVGPNDPEADPVEPLAPKGDEIVIKKTSSGVFNSTNIDYVLRNIGIKYLVIAGILTDQCVDMAVRDAADRGYFVTCISDACAAPSQERHESALRAFGGYCWTADSDTVIERFAKLNK
ncbi:isochorismatase family domain-containing protein [Ditylenchus destructor]|nr:isochorismatase family domain-containing protein [Ditylenchus destructor]